jgi:heat shock protein HslJ
MKRFEIIALIVMVSLTVAAGVACAGRANADSLTGITWVLKSYGNPDHLTAVLPDKEVTLTFVEAEKAARGNSGVNLYGGKYVIDGNKLTITNITMTLMAGQENLMQQENAYHNILQFVQSYKVSGDVLTITGTAGVLNFSSK